MKGHFRVLLLLSFVLLCFSCKVKRMTGPVTVATPVIQAAIAKQAGEDFQQVFKRVLENKQTQLSYPNAIRSFYQSKTFQPVLIPHFMVQDQLQTLLSYFEAVSRHGLDPKLFAVTGIKKMRERLYVKKGLTLNVYQDVVELELQVASSLLKYSNALQFGLLNPAQIDSNYFTPTAQPDSILMLRVLEVRDLKAYLDSIQPKGKKYLAIQTALKDEMRAPKKTLEETQRILKVNLERLRWKNKPTEQKFVRINIPDFNLQVIEKGVSVLQMKVCVGEKGKETPQLGSKIYSVQVNPVWNIPESIAKNEISKYAGRDKYYLANNNIHVFKQGKLINDPEAIDWAKENVSSYSFKQQPGYRNSLGKIKFLFKNESSVYLHDTPVKAAFNQPVRAISHGCVRVEKPLLLALALFEKGKKYEQIKSAMQRGYPRAKYIGLPSPVPVFITYYTTDIDEKGKLVFYDDIYGLDKMLYAKLQDN